MAKKEVFNLNNIYEVKCTKKQFEEIYNDYDNEKCDSKYFNCFVLVGLGRVMFLKQQYFVSYFGEKNYGIAFCNCIGLNTQEISNECWF